MRTVLDNLAIVILDRVLLAVERRDDAVVPRLLQRPPDADALADGVRVPRLVVVALDPSELESSSFAIGRTASTLCAVRAFPIQVSLSFSMSSIRRRGSKRRERVDENEG